MIPTCVQSGRETPNQLLLHHFGRGNVNNHGWDMHEMGESLPSSKIPEYLPNTLHKVSRISYHWFGPVLHGRPLIPAKGKSQRQPKIGTVQIVPPKPQTSLTDLQSL
jgi:hypothetical protein